MRNIPAGITQLIKSKSMLGSDAPTGWVEFPTFGESYVLQVTSMSVQREEAADAQRLVFSFPNVNPADPTDTGYYTPYRSTDFGKTANMWQNVLVPSTRVVAKMGYGSNIATVFTGEIDEVRFSANPNDYTVSVDCRDLACLLIDKQIKLVLSGETEYYIEYPLPAGVTKFWLDPGAVDIPDIADIVKDLCMRAGFAADDVIVEQTGIQLDPMWEKMSYMDCINDLCTAAGFEFWVDEDGKANFFHQSDRKPNISGQSVVLNGTEWADLGHVSIVSTSDVVKDVTDVTTYSRTTDYEIDLVNGKLRRTAGSTIADGATVHVSYVFAGHIYREGEDIYGLNLTISRRNMYGTIRVAGDGEEASATVTSPLWDGSRVDLDKVLFADNQYLDELTKVQKCANRLKSDMLNRYVSTDFVCVAHPWLQVGDCVQVIESSSTISEIYKVTSISFDLNPDGFSSNIKAFHVGYTPLSATNWELLADAYDGTYGNEIKNMIVYNDELYAGCNGRLLKYSSGAWVQVADKYLSGDTAVFIAEYNNKIYGGNGIYNPSGELLEWNGTNAWTLKAPQLNGQSWPNFLIVYNNELYAATQTGSRLFKWNGTNAWVEVAGQAGGTENYMYTLCEYNGKIYGGTFPNGQLYEWNGSNAWVLKAPQLNGQTQIKNLIVFNDALYGCTSGGRLFKWNDSDAWIQIASVDATLHYMAVLGNQLYVVGSNGVLYRLYNSTLQQVCRYSAGIFTLMAYDGALYGGTINGQLIKCVP
ncbi:MAG TPA: hypothetical protein PLD76_04795 [Paludibacteraceae bacterium]|nr:hypothetical protein [Paludibacteraceae bacterium]